jgi:hypothetical protein
MAAEAEAARVKAEQQAQMAAEAEAARVKAEQEAQMAAEAEAAEQEAQMAAEAEAARVKAEQEAQMAAEAEVARLAQVSARFQAKEESGAMASKAPFDDQVQPDGKPDIDAYVPSIDRPVRVGRRASVLEDFEAEDEDELDVKTNDQVLVTEMIDDQGWVKVQSLKTGAIGLVPGSFIVEMEESSTPEHSTGTRAT